MNGKLGDYQWPSYSHDMAIIWPGYDPCTATIRPVNGHYTATLGPRIEISHEQEVDYGRLLDNGRLLCNHYTAALRRRGKYLLRWVRIRGIAISCSFRDKPGYLVISATNLDFSNFRNRLRYFLPLTWKIPGKPRFRG